MRTIISSFAILIISALLIAAVEPLVITGRVTDDHGNSLAGVSVFVKNTKRGTQTDLSGHYRISLQPGDKVLVFSFLGMETTEVKIKEKKIINVKLYPEAIEPEEVLVREYPRIKSQKLTGAVATYDMAAGSYTYSNLPPAYNPNFNTEGYATIHENGYKDVLKQPLSTFSIDVDKASYANVRRFINMGQLPPMDAVRIEEMINYFTYDYPEPRGKHPFSVYTELAACPWNPDHQLLHIGLKGKSIDKTELSASNLVFLLDVSGSMNSPNKLPLLKNAFHMLVNELRDEDRVAIVVYAGAAGLVLKSTPGNRKEDILSAIDKLSAGGSTAGGQGLLLAYKVAEENFIEGGNNRIILATDGDFNVGVSSNAEMERLVEKKRDNGVFMTVLGFGMGNYKDDKMELIADKGNGNYAYIDNIQEARKVLVAEFGGTLFTIAKDVKFQLEFNPARVKAYRLIGYENRLLNDEDFNDDKKDAGEMGAGHNVTALYELIPAGSEENTGSIDPLKYQENSHTARTDLKAELLTVKLRYKQPDGKTSTLFEEPVQGRLLGEKSTSESFRFSAAVAEFGLILRDSEYKEDASVEQIISLAQGGRGNDSEGYRGEFIKLVRTAGTLIDMRAEK
ncbi:MAG: von Willebrand factor type A domain-containing protein [Bacteroidales bacterium]